MNPLLYGHDPKERVIAVHHSGDSTMDVYVRDNQSVGRERVEFYPFFFLSDKSYLERFSSRYWLKELDGEHAFRYLAVFTGWTHMWSAIHDVLAQYNKTATTQVQSYNELPVLYFRPDPSYQFLLQRGMTLFKGMEFNDLHRLQIDIQTLTRHSSFRNVSTPEDQIIIVSLSDNHGWEQVLTAKDFSEQELLQQLTRTIRERDPDVIEGYNLFSGELSYLLKRYALYGIDFAIGRDGSSPRTFDSRVSFAEQQFDVVTFDVAGRHFIDTRLLLQSFDATKRVLEHDSLSHAAQYFGVGKTGRPVIPLHHIPRYWTHEREALIENARENVREIRQLSDILSRSVFYLAQMLPFNYGHVARTGSSVKIESLLVREYLRQRHSLPRPDTRVQMTGGYTDIFATGVLGPVVEVDIVSLYPSIMLNDEIRPQSERLGIFLSLLRQLTEMRLDAKRTMQKAHNDEERSMYDAMQSSYKILINSFYGYLGYFRALFSDARAADRVTATGQEILRSLMGMITNHHGKIVEVDTDGIYFIPPFSIRGEESERQFVATIAQMLPKGITLSFRGRYRSILSYKIKNYALLGYDGTITIKGSSLRSRAHERFAQKFLHQCIESLLASNVAALHDAYVTLRRDITDHRLTITDFARTETLRDSVDEYLASRSDAKRNPGACYEVALAAGLTWKPGDRISYYISGTQEDVRGFEYAKLADEWNPLAPDENVPYYLKRLDEMTKKFEPFFLPGNFRSIFSVENLFPFSPEGIQVLTTAVKEEDRALVPDDEEELRLNIWLDDE